MLRRLRVTNYRSLRDVTIELGQLTIVTGPNGSGKSNLYKALRLLQAAAQGQLSASLLSEGGMPSALWAGARGKGPVRLGLEIALDDLTFALEAGLAPKGVVHQGEPEPFVLDPAIKTEHLHYGPRPTKAGTVVDRGNATATLIDSEGETHTLVASLDPAESILSQVSDPTGFPELANIQRTLNGWRFYHRFDTSDGSPIRRINPGVRVGALARDGRDLAAALATLRERGDSRAVTNALDVAFPGYSLQLDLSEPGRFGVGLRTNGLNRPLTGAELSDGQLQFLCLVAALLSSRPPELLVLNEPETSLHPAAVEALAPLLQEAARFSQVWVTTHSTGLRDLLADDAHGVSLAMRDGETTIGT